jgi:DNA-binding transcriptional regulator YdaS (Cro superfamily)
MSGMDLKSFLALKSAAERDEFASRCETSRGHLQNVMYGWRPCATDLAVSIERESEGSVRRWDLRPSDWDKHWPELIGAKGAPKLRKRAA